MEASDGGGRSGSGFSCINMNHHHHNNNQNNDMVMGFNGVGAGGGDNTMMMMMMPPLSTTTTTTSTTNTTSCSPTTSSTGFCFPPLPLLLPPPHHQAQDHATNNNNSSSNNNNQFCVGAGGGRGGRGGVASNLSMEFSQENQNPQHFINKPSSYYPMTDLHNIHNPGSSSSSSPYNSSSIKAKIMAHPHYPRLLAAYINCQKVGAPPEVVARLEEACAATTEVVRTTGYIGEDPGLDQFMEAYCEMLTKYEQELSKPFKEAMVFLSRIESQFKALTLSSSSSNNNAAAANISSSSAYHAIPAANSSDGNGSSDEEIDMNTNFIDPQAEDTELKCQLLRKYSGYLGSLKQEFMKKRKKGKLPKEARQQLLDWWTRHYKWPYPSEAQKMALAEATGLDPKQINNWFINQRKRHWKPSEDMQFVVMDAAHPHHYYMDHNNVLGNPFPMDISPALL